MNEQQQPVEMENPGNADENQAGADGKNQVNTDSGIETKEGGCRNRNGRFCECDREQDIN